VLYTARGACSGETPGKVLEAIGRLVGLRLDIALVERPADGGSLSTQAH